MVKSKTLRRLALAASIVTGGVAVGTVACTKTAMAQFAGAVESSRGDSLRGERDTDGERTPPTKRAIQIVLREGTFVGPLRGRFVVRGQRWSFLVESQTRSTELGKSEWVEGGIAREILPDQDTLLGRHRNANPADTDGEAVAPGLGQPSAEMPRAVVTAPAFDSMVVIENLMLDRISRAIEEDLEDDYWMITATVTEFQDENRLLLLTAKRARSNR
ncbi:hypothetical protein [Rhodopirellula sp. SWK7]|uniref:hypothetical protein n=1 Tax=Rhodopirellula sp. SWK7 TaxID=595460 RepID=UPI0002BFE3A5|nr:hypothetical protein [Rhodopirellula sp. SWK7]EMI46947.1 signal peptide protein [Rhodopirellula sp. SWK7]